MCSLCVTLIYLAAAKLANATRINKDRPLISQTSSKRKRHRRHRRHHRHHHQKGNNFSYL